MYVGGLPEAGVGELAAAHVGRRQRRLAVVDLAVEVDDVRVVGQGVGRVDALREHRRRVVPDVPVQAPQPPVPAGEVVADLELVLRAAVRRERRERDARVDLRVRLHPAAVVAVPAADVVALGAVPVRREVAEQMRRADLVGVVDPAGLDRLRHGPRARVRRVRADHGRLQQGEVPVALRVGLEQAEGALASKVEDVLSRTRVPMLTGVASSSAVCLSKTPVVLLCGETLDDGLGGTAWP